MYIKYLRSGKYCVMPDMYEGTHAQCVDYIKTKPVKL